MKNPPTLETSCLRTGMRSSLGEVTGFVLSYLIFNSESTRAEQKTQTKNHLSKQNYDYCFLRLRESPA